VPRTRLLRVLRQAGHQPIISVVAPAGFGKTTLLAQWASSGPAIVAWVTVGQGHNDPVLLFVLLATALFRQQVVDARVLDALASPRLTSYALAGRLMAAVRDGTVPVKLVIDDLHVLTSQPALDAIGELLSHLPPSWRVAIAGRDALALPLARWRSRGTLVEIGPAELAMDDDEVASLVRHLGLEPSADELRELVRSSGGWPAIIYLGALAARRNREAGRPVVHGSHPSISDYLRSELLGGRTDEEISFLIGTSILDSLTVPLCDAVVGREGSARLLHALVRSTLLVDDRGGVYRYHSLLRQFLLDELARRETDVARLHRRAAAWYEREGSIDAAIDHAFAAGDLDHAAAMVAKVFVRYRWSGRRATTRAWLGRFSEQALEQRPWLALLAAIEETGIGDVAAAEKLADVVGRASLDGRPVDGTTSVESNKVLMRAIMCRSGAADMLESASRVVELEGPGSGWRSVALWILANARLLAGDLDGADASLADAVADAVAAAAAGHNAGTLQVALGQRALLAIDRGDWSAAAAFAREAGTVVASAHLDDYQITACTAAALARIAVHRGDIRAATDELTRAVVLRPQLTATLPWLNVLALLSLARAHLAVSDPGGAQTLLAQARDVIRLRPDLGTLPAQVVALQAELNERPIGLAGASSLTAAELRVLQFLPLYLSFKEIGERLDVKASTVQTHAVAIYGKLGASSRSEAVDLAIAARLLEAPTNWATTSHHAWDAKRLEG